MGGGGLNRLEPDTGQVTRYQHDPEDPASLGDNNIFDLHFDRAGVLWIGLAGAGLDRFDPAAGTFSHYREPDGLAFVPRPPSIASQSRSLGLDRDCASKRRCACVQACRRFRPRPRAPLRLTRRE